MDNIDKLLTDLHDCRKCEVLKPWDQFSVGIHGNKSSKIMLIGEAPGKDSIDHKEYWHNNIIRKTLKDTYGRKLEELFYLTDLVKCCTKAPKLNVIANCTEYTMKEIELINPKLILGFGRIVLEFFRDNFDLGINDTITNLHTERGYQIFKCDNDDYKFKFIPLILPSNANRFIKNMDLYKNHLRDAYKEVI
jgi:uracil-DNA glycosylase family 4